MAKLRNIIETTTVPAPVKPAPTKPKPDIKPWNPPRPKEDTAPKAGTTTTEPKPGTIPAKPKPKPDIKPWNPPRPKEDPAPKAKAFIFEAYEDEVNPSTRDFWGGLRKSQHTFAKHPILAMYGEESAKKAFVDNVERLSRAFPEFNNLPQNRRLQMVYQKSVSLFQQVMRIEARYKTQLEQIAKETVSEVYGIPEDAMIASLTMNAGANFDSPQKRSKPQETVDQEFGDSQEYGESEEGTDRPDVQDQINKRVTLNILTQGAAVHNMMTIYNLASEKINDLNPQLLQMYKELSPGMLSMYWLQDFIAMAEMLRGAVAGSVKVVYSDDEEEEVEVDEFEALFNEPKQKSEEEGPKIHALGMCFPILIQELVKGVMELLSHHGLADLDEQTTSQVLKSADVLTDEPWLIQVGPHIWRSFLKIIPKGSDLAMVVAKLATKDPKFIHDLLSQTIEEVHGDRDPVNQRQAIQDMIDEIEEYTGEDIEDLM